MIPALSLLLFGLLHGLVEGQIMTRYTDPMADPDAQDDMDGVRVHRWFGAYHALCIARYVALVAVIIAVYHFPQTGKLVMAGAAVLAWELSEMAYNFARYREFVTEHENVFGLYSLDGADTWLLHSFRFLLGTGLIVGGYYV